MFKCGVCGKSSQPGEKAHPIVLETRAVVYPKREEVHHFTKDRKKMVKDDPGGRGTEIARQINACTACAKEVK